MGTTVSLMAQVQKLKEEITQRTTKLRELQEKCEHPEGALTRQTTSSEYVPVSEIEYTTHIHCGICDKHWTKKKS